MLELPCQAFTDLPRTAFDLAPVTGLDLELFGKTPFQATQRGGIGLLDGGLHKLIKQPHRIVEADARHIMHRSHA